MVAGEVESSCQLVATLFFFFFFGLTLPNYRNKSGSAQPPLISTTSSAAVSSVIREESVIRVQYSHREMSEYLQLATLIQELMELS